jgi:hypothetical protein
VILLILVALGAAGYFTAALVREQVARVSSSLHERHFRGRFGISAAIILFSSIENSATSSPA